MSKVAPARCLLDFPQLLRRRRISRPPEPSTESLAGRNTANQDGNGRERAGKPLKSDKCQLIGDLDATSDPFQSLRTSNSPSMARLSAIKMETHRGNAYRVIK